jgi:hypothetical protein
MTKNNQLKPAEDWKDLQRRVGINFKIEWRREGRWKKVPPAKGSW